MHVTYVDACSACSYVYDVITTLSTREVGECTARKNTTILCFVFVNFIVIRAGDYCFCIKQLNWIRFQRFAM